MSIDRIYARKSCFLIPSASIKCPWYSIWLVASQPTRISAVMKSTFIQPRWLGRSFYSFFFLSIFLSWLSDTFIFIAANSVWVTEGAFQQNQLRGITKHRKIPKPQKILSHAGSLMLCSKSSITGVTLNHKRQPWNRERKLGKERERNK